MAERRRYERRSFTAGYRLAMRRARADLDRMAASLADEVEALRRELREAEAEFHRLRAIDAGQRAERDLGMPLQ
jgi:hypothetical protein